MNATDLLTRPGTPDGEDTRPAAGPATDGDTPRHDPARPGGGAAGDKTNGRFDGGASGGPGDRAGERTARRSRDTDGMAVASFVLGLTGLLVFNLVLGPLALVLGGLALARGTGRRGRALLGTALGAADLLVLAATVAADHTVSWSIAAQGL